MESTPGQRKDSYKWQVLGIVMIGTLMSALDSSIVNVSIPAIMADFGAGIDDIEWVVTAYMLAFATLMPLTAWLRDKVGHKWLYIASLIVFTIGSVLCGLAWNLPMLIGARVIQAAGGGALTPTGMAMITESFGKHERGKALGFWGMGAVMGPAFGPTLGGYLTRYFGWPSIFLVNLPIGIIGVVMAMRILRADKPVIEVKKPFDLWGFLFLSLFLVSFLLGLSKGESKGWGSTYVVTCGILSALGFLFFLVVEKVSKNRIIELPLLADPVFFACFLLTAIRSVVLYGGTFLLPLFLQNLRGLDEVEAGLILLPGSLLMGVLMPFTGRLGDKVSPRTMGFVGFALLGTFFYEYRALDTTTSNLQIILPTLVRGIGISLLMAPLTATAMNAFETKMAGMVSSMLNLIQQVGGSIGIAVLSLVLDHRTTHHLSLAGSSITPGSTAYQSAFRGLAAHAHDVGMNHADSARAAGGLIGREVGRFAGVRGFQDAFLFGSALVFVSLLAVFLLPNRPVAHDSEEPIMME